MELTGLRISTIDGKTPIAETLNVGDPDWQPTWHVKLTNNGSGLQFSTGNKNKCENRVRLSLNAAEELAGKAVPADDTQSIDLGCEHKTYNQPANYFFGFYKLPPTP
jgi:hypothetical protein